MPKIASKTPALDKLTQRQRATVIAYSDPESPTYDNKVQSTLSAYPQMTYATAANHGYLMMKKPEVQDALHEILEARDAGYTVRVGHLADMALGRAEQATVTEQYDAAGKPIGTTVATKNTPPHVQLQALKKISHDTGEDAITLARNSILSDELYAIGARILKAHRLGATGATSDDDAIDSDSYATDVEERGDTIDSVAQPQPTPDAHIDMQADTHNHADSGAGDRETGTGGKARIAHITPSPPEMCDKKTVGGDELPLGPSH